MGAIKAAIADGLLTFMWVLCASSIEVLTPLIAGYIGLPQPQWMVSLFIPVMLLFAFVSIFEIIGDLLDGAAYNPTAGATSYAAGLDCSFSLYSAAFRFPAQAAGAALGALTLTKFMPVQYKHMVGRPSLKVDMHTGAIAEGVFTFILSFLTLLIAVKGPRNALIKTFLLVVANFSLMIAGSSYSGPSMNPANAFGWAYVYDNYNTWEHFYVYWICPLAGSILAAWVFRVLVQLPAEPKQKKA